MCMAMKCSIQKTCTKLIYWRNLVMNDNAGPTCFYSVIVLLNNTHSSICDRTHTKIKGPFKPFHVTSSIYRYTIHKKLWSLISGIYNRLPEQGLQRTSTSRRSRAILETSKFSLYFSGSCIPINPKLSY